MAKEVKPEDPTPELLEEAAMIFVQIQDAPDNSEHKAARDAFLARGVAAQSAYARIEASWRLPVARPASKLPILLPFMVGMGLALSFGWTPARIYMLADARSGTETARVSLVSGDSAYLDSGSALVDETGDGARHVAILQGAALFEVTPQPHPFTVTVGDLQVEVKSTIFETALTSESAVVSVLEGAVDVRFGEEVWSLEPGDRFDWSDEGEWKLASVPLPHIGAWREDRLIVTDMTVAQVADAIDRRQNRPVLVIGERLGQTRISGSFDLTKPASALRALAGIVDARLIEAGPLGVVLYSAP